MDSGDDRYSTAGVGLDWTLFPGPTSALIDRVETRSIHVDKGYRGHDHKEKFRVWITGQVRRVTRHRGE